jgi:hypothetical protein
MTTTTAAKGLAALPLFEQRDPDAFKTRKILAGRLCNTI